MSHASPLIQTGQMVRDLLNPGEFVEVFVDVPLEVAERRDPKGLYRRARAGEIRHFTGIDSPYEPPPQPEVHLHTDDVDVDACVKLALDALRERGVVR